MLELRMEFSGILWQIWMSLQNGSFNCHQILQFSVNHLNIVVPNIKYWSFDLFKDFSYPADVMKTPAWDKKY